MLYSHYHIQWNLSYQTLQIKDAIEKTSIIKTKILVPTGVTNNFKPLKEETSILQQKMAKNTWSQIIHYREVPL